MATLYTYLDDGSPWVPPEGVVYPGDTLFFDKVFGEVLQYVLVDGHGWERTYALPGVAYAYKPPSGLYEFIVRRCNSSWHYPIMFLAESVSSYPTSTTNQPVGENLRSYHWSPDSNTGGRMQGKYGVGYMYGAQWSIVADDTFFAFSLDADNQQGWTNGEHDSGSSYALYVGEFNHEMGLQGLPRIGVFGGIDVDHGGNGPYSYSPFGPGTTVLRDPLTGLVPFGALSLFELDPGLGMVVGTISPSWRVPEVASSKITLVPLSVVYKGAKIGTLKGLCWDPSWRTDYRAGAAAKALGLIDAATFKSWRSCFSHRFQLPGGDNYTLSGKNFCPFLLTDNPEFS